MKNKIYFLIKKHHPYIICAIVVLIILISDQVAKNIIYYQQIESKNGILAIQPFLNSSIAFSSLNSFTGIPFLILEGLLFLVFIAFMIFLKEMSLKLGCLILTLAILGNLIDRLHTPNQSIIDYIVFNANFYFNITDIVILIGIIWLFASFILTFFIQKKRKYKNHDKQ